MLGRWEAVATCAGEWADSRTPMREKTEPGNARDQTENQSSEELTGTGLNPGACVSKLKTGAPEHTLELD